MNQRKRALSGKSPRRSRMAFWVIVAIAAYLLLVEYGGHVFEFLPYALILACPLMHVFHRGHGGHGHDDQAPYDGPSTHEHEAGAPPDEHRH